MAATDVTITNRGLILLGEKTITALSDSNKRAEAANALFEDTRDAVLEMGHWKSARKLATLGQDTTHAVTVMAWSASVVTVTSAEFTDVAVGDEIKIVGAVPTGYNGTHTVTTIDDPGADDFAFALTTDPGTVTTLPTVVDPVTPDWGFNNQFEMPTDFLRLITLEDISTPYEIHIDKLLTDASAVKMEYVYQSTAYSSMSPMLREAISVKLAYDLSYHLDTSKRKQNDMERLFDRTMAFARNVDASQRNDDVMDASEWLLGRESVASAFRKLGPVPTS